MNLVLKLMMTLLLVQGVPTETGVKSEVKRKYRNLNVVGKILELLKTLFWIVISILTALLIGRLN